MSKAAHSRIPSRDMTVAPNKAKDASWTNPQSHDDDGSKSLQSLVTQVSRNDSTPKTSVDKSEAAPAIKMKRTGSFFASMCSCFKSTEPKQRRSIQMRRTTVVESILGPQLPQHLGKKTLVLDLDETLVHSSFRPIDDPDMIIPVEIENRVHHVYVLKRPGVDEFLQRMAEIYEVVIYTASLAKYADPLLDQLDPYSVCAYRLFREACVPWNGNYVKDLARLGRDLKSQIIIDNSPISYSFQPGNAIPIKSWFDDPYDRELYDLIPILEAMAMVDDVVEVLDRLLNKEDDDEPMSFAAGNPPATELTSGNGVPQQEQEVDVNTYGNGHRAGSTRQLDLTPTRTANDSRMSIQKTSGYEDVSPNRNVNNGRGSQRALYSN
eukprot:GILK01001052.1.p1 GENE.GILK01001052.1~~GILK01001052.1.p1  ORF type:complete len:379 (+),score=73.57 GILK01001052.1:280-1416(+)